MVGGKEAGRGRGLRRRRRVGSGLAAAAAAGLWWWDQLSCKDGRGMAKMAEVRGVQEGRKGWVAELLAAGGKGKAVAAPG